MKDEEETKEQFIEKLAEMRQQVAELEAPESERKRAEEALRDSRHMLQTVLDSIPAAVFWKDRDSIYFGGNRTFLEAAGLKSSEEVVGKSDYDLPWEKRQADWFREDDRRVMESGIPEYGIIEPYLRADSTHAWAKTNKVPLRDTEGNVVGILGTYEDITERKRAEEALRRSERRLKEAQAMGRIGDWKFDVDNQKITWSDQVFKLYERDPGLGAPTLEEEATYYSPEQARILREYARRSIETGQEFEYDLEVKLPSGRTGYFSACMHPIKDENGRVVELLGTVQDITERKRAEEAVELKMEQLTALSSASQAVTSSLELNQVLAEVVSLASEVVTSDYTSVILVNEAGHMGQSAENLSGVPAIEYRVREEGFTGWIVRSRQSVVVDEIDENGAVSPDLGEDALHTANPHLVEIGVKSLVGLPLVAKDRLLGVLYLHSLHPHAFQGQLPLLTTFANQAAIAIENARLYQEAQRELAERKRAEEALRESEQRYRSLFEGAEDPIFVLDQDFRYLMVNASAIKAGGFTPEDVVGKGPREVFPRDAEFYLSQYRQVFETGEPAWFERELRLPDGPHWFSVTLSPIKDAQGRVMALTGISRDITEHKRAEEEVQRHLERVEALREIDRAITSTLDLPRVLDIILEKLERVISYHSAGIFLFSDGTAKLTAGRGFPDLKRVLQVSFPVKEDPLTHKLLQEKRPLVLADAQADQRFLARGGTGYVRSWIGVPLIAKGKVMGFLTVDHREAGVYDEESAETVQAFASQAAIAIENARLYQETQRELAERKQAQAELLQSYTRLEKTLEGTIHTLVSATEMRDPYTAGHQRRVTQLACTIANKMGLSEEQCEGLRMAGLIHDVGKINVPADILSKPGRLNEIEFGLIKMHPQVGHDILKAIEFPWPVAQIVLQHHERMDGSGYPYRLSGEEITLEARILAVADVVEAMASHRPYRPARGIDEALREISQHRGILYDPEVVDACLKLFTENGFEFEQGEGSDFKQHTALTDKA